MKPKPESKPELEQVVQVATYVRRYPLKCLSPVICMFWNVQQQHQQKWRAPWFALWLRPCRLLDFLIILPIILYLFLLLDSILPSISSLLTNSMPVQILSDSYFMVCSAIMLIHSLSSPFPHSLLLAAGLFFCFIIVIFVGFPKKISGFFSCVFHSHSAGLLEYLFSFDN